MKGINPNQISFTSNPIERVNIMKIRSYEPVYVPEVYMKVINPNQISFTSNPIKVNQNVIYTFPPTGRQGLACQPLLSDKRVNPGSTFNKMA